MATPRPLAAWAALVAVLLAVALAPASVRAVRPGATATAAAAVLRPDGAPKQPPRPPTSYSVNYTLSLPYTATIPGQPLLRYPVAFMVDGLSSRLRMSLHPDDDQEGGGGSTTMIQRKGALFEVVPRYDRQVRAGSGGWVGGAVHRLGAAAAHRAGGTCSLRGPTAAW